MCIARRAHTQPCTLRARNEEEGEITNEKHKGKQNVRTDEMYGKIKQNNKMFAKPNAR